MTEDNDIVVRTVRGKEIARITIPGSAGRVAAFNVTFLPGDNSKMQDLTVQLHEGPGDHEAEVIESHGIIGFAPNVQRGQSDDDEIDDEE